MSEHSHKVILIDMLQATEKLLEYTKGYDFEKYLDDEKTRSAVYHKVIVLGEAVSRMPDHFIQDHSEIPWQKMISTRNAVVHGYDKIDDKIVWNIIENILPDLKRKLEKLLSEL